jgi:S-adenosylmethionine hydrolase
MSRDSVNCWTVTIVDDDEGNLMLPLTEEMLEAAGLKVGDELVWEIKSDAVYLTKKNPTTEVGMVADNSE